MDNKPKHNKHHRGHRSSSLNPEVFTLNQPQALERDVSTPTQTRFGEGTIIYGDGDDLPLRILQAVELSPTTTSCLDVVTDFISGSGFSDEGLMDMVIDKEGTTLWQLHCQLAEYMAKLDGFSVNHKFDAGGKIIYSYNLPLEFNRFVKPPDGVKKISKIKYNPYFGTSEHDTKYTTPYHVWDPKEVHNQYGKEGNGYMGQVYYQGSVRALYKFYPVPKYWTGKDWIYVDGQIQNFHKANLDNGFFQSTLINVIGDPNLPSKNPKYTKEITGEDGVKRIVHEKTEGQEFNEMMGAKFSGAKKAGTVMALWSKNKDASPTIEAFPSNINFDLLSGTLTDAIRGICIATKTPAILANLPQQASSLGSDGNAMQKGVELMQSRTVRPRTTLEQYYNKILLPNSSDKAASKLRVKILDFKPISTVVTIEDKFWEVMTPQEKREFVRVNVPGTGIKEEIVLLGEDGQPAPAPQEAKVNENIKNMSGRQLQSIQRIVRQFNKEAITFEQAAKLLKDGFAFTDEDVNIWLVTKEEE